MRLSNIILARDATTVRFDDLTSAKPTGEPRWVPGEMDVLEVPLDREPTPTERVKIRRRLVTPDAATEARVTSYAEARTALRGIKGLTPPLAVIVTAVTHLLDEALARYGE